MGERKVLMSPAMRDLTVRIRESAANGNVKLFDECVKTLELLEDQEKYFYNIFRGKISGNKEDFEFFEEYLPHEAIKYRRVLVITNTFGTFLKGISAQGVYGLDSRTLDRIVCGYVEDVVALKQRYKCETIQLPKIAGLMAHHITKYRPIVAINACCNPYPFINELFAVYHGLCVCSDFSNGQELVNFNNHPDCKDFLMDMRYLLSRNYTSESLVMIFKTLSMKHFPSYLDTNAGE